MTLDHFFELQTDAEHDCRELLESLKDSTGMINAAEWRGHAPKTLKIMRVDMIFQPFKGRIVIAESSEPLPVIDPRRDLWDFNELPIGDAVGFNYMPEFKFVRELPAFSGDSPSPL